MRPSRPNRAERTSDDCQTRRGGDCRRRCRQGVPGAPPGISKGRLSGDSPRICRHVPALSLCVNLVAPRWTRGGNGTGSAGQVQGLLSSYPLTRDREQPDLLPIRRNGGRDAIPAGPGLFKWVFLSCVGRPTGKSSDSSKTQSAETHASGIIPAAPSAKMVRPLAASGKEWSRLLGAPRASKR